MPRSPLCSPLAWRLINGPVYVDSELYKGPIPNQALISTAEDFAYTGWIYTGNQRTNYDLNILSNIQGQSDPEGSGIPSIWLQSTGQLRVHLSVKAGNLLKSIRLWSASVVLIEVADSDCSRCVSHESTTVFVDPVLCFDKFNVQYDLHLDWWSPFRIGKCRHLWYRRYRANRTSPGHVNAAFRDQRQLWFRDLPVWNRVLFKFTGSIYWDILLSSALCFR